jgi:hypothetical protein
VQTYPGSIGPLVMADILLWVDHDAIGRRELSGEWLPVAKQQIHITINTNIIYSSTPLLFAIIALY